MANTGFLWLALFPAAFLPVSALGGAAFAWWLTREEKNPDDATLLRHFLVGTGLVLVMTVAIPRADWFRARFDPATRIEKPLLADPVNAALQKLQPGEWRRLEAQAKRDAQALLSQKEVLSRARAAQMPLVRHHVQFAAGSTLLAYQQALHSALRELEGQDPKLCVALAWPKARTDFDVRGRLSPETAD